MKPRWATEEYATSRLRSFCTRAVSAPYRMPITPSVSMTGPNHEDASGNKKMPNRMSPYVPIFSITPARMTEPAVGASVWASGSHVCSGKIGTLMANAAANARNNQREVFLGRFASASLVMSKVSSPMFFLARNANVTIATSMRPEPTIVNRKNFVAA